MTIVQIQGRDMRDALVKAREQVGEKAVVVSHHKVHGGITLAVSEEIPRSTHDLERMREEARRLLASWAQAQRPLHRGTSDVERSLRGRGASRRLTERICEAVAGRLDEGRHPLDIAAEELGPVFPIARTRHIPGNTSILAFVGSAGAGKTTTVAKIAARMARAGRRVAMVTLDTHRVGAVEQLRALGGELGIPTRSTRDARSVARMVAGDRRPDVILLDTSGRPRKDAAALLRLRATLEKYELEAHLETFVVLSAVSRPVVVEEIIGSLGDLAVTGCVVTKVDETAKPVPVLELVGHKRLGVAFISNGRDLTRDLHRARPELFADLCLKGKVS